MKPTRTIAVLAGRPGRAAVSADQGQPIAWGDALSADDGGGVIAIVDPPEMAPAGSGAVRIKSRLVEARRNRSRPRVSHAIRGTVRGENAGQEYIPSKSVVTRPAILRLLPRDRGIATHAD